MLLSDVCLSDVCLSRTSSLSREQRGLGQCGLRLSVLGQDRSETVAAARLQLVKISLLAYRLRTEDPPIASSVCRVWTQKSRTEARPNV